LATFDAQFDTNAHVLFQKLVDKGDDAVLEFQERLCSVIQRETRSHDASHKALAHLLHEQVVVHVVSLNWDQYIESALDEVGKDRKGYRRPLNAVYFQDEPKSDEWLWKPHGCTSQPNRPWVLPHQGVQLNPHFRTICHEIRSRNDGSGWIVLSIGLSATDTFDFSTLEDIFMPGTLTVDVRPEIPHARGKKAMGTASIHMTSTWVLNKLMVGA
jgi:hypothetical protein